MKISRKLYKRGSSFEITIPRVLLFNVDLKKKNNVVFDFRKGRWYVKIKRGKLIGEKRY